jgi:hypothetical protein
MISTILYNMLFELQATLIIILLDIFTKYDKNKITVFRYITIFICFSLIKFL